MSIACDSGSLPLGNQEIGANAETVGGVWQRKSVNPAIVYFESGPQQKAPRT
jgi:hypothetical protein